MHRTQVERLLPHAGAMCLIDTVLAWDREHIICETARHRAIDNPLRAHGRLAAIHAIEFAAQAMAAHRRLADAEADMPARGLLVSVRDCSFAVGRLDDCENALVVEAIRIAATANAITYRFTVGPAGHPLAQGRACVALVTASL